jgi:hypothetical protein
VHFDETRAVEPLDAEPAEQAADAPQPYPSTL